ncbi:hypothetical protein P7L87_24650 [Vibrio parahaemolyticus]|nr:hypothetical protein [Vibrio parahaemolyticus]
MDVKLLQDRFEVSQHSLGFRRVLPSLAHLLNKVTLLGKTRLSLGYAPVGQGELFAFVLQVGHGRSEHALSRAEAPRISQKAIPGL